METSNFARSLLLFKGRQQAEDQIDQYLKYRQSLRTASDNDDVRIIPVVFHIIQEGFPENIPVSQIVNAVQVFNEDYRRQNADAINTPAAFKPVAADTKIAFRLATIDPNGNCTNGITRTFTHRTELFNDYGKSIIDWPSDRYLNIWVAKSIGLTTGEKRNLCYWLRTISCNKTLGNGWSSS